MGTRTIAASVGGIATGGLGGGEVTLDVRTLTIEDVVGTWPEPTRIDNLHGQSPIDLYVGALGFEQRCLALPEAIAKAGLPVGRALVAEYDSNQSANNRNRDSLEAALGAVGARARFLGPGLSTFESEFESALSALVNDGSASGNVWLDISVASNRFVMSAIRRLLAHDVNLTIVYAEAQRYYPTQDDWQLNRELWDAPDDHNVGLEVGVGELDVTVDVPGYHTESLPDTVIVVAGFGPDRARAAIARVNPALLTVPGSEVEWILGIPHLEHDAWRIDAQRLINRIPSDAKVHTISTFDYRDIIGCLEGIYRRRSGTRHLTLVPLGSKMQALGCALYCHMRRELRVVFSSPREYRVGRYSEGFASRWSLPLGSTAALRDSMALVDLVVVEGVR